MDISTRANLSEVEQGQVRQLSSLRNIFIQELEKEILEKGEIEDDGAEIKMDETAVTALVNINREKVRVRATQLANGVTKALLDVGALGEISQARLPSISIEGVDLFEENKSIADARIHSVRSNSINTKFERSSNLIIEEENSPSVRASESSYQPVAQHEIQLPPLPQFKNEYSKCVLKVPCTDYERAVIARIINQQFPFPDLQSNTPPSNILSSARAENLPKSSCCVVS